METQKLQATAMQRIQYFQNGADKDGIEIASQQHLMFAYEYVAMALRHDLGALADEYLDKEIVPYFKDIARKLSQEG